MNCDLLETFKKFAVRHPDFALIKTSLEDFEKLEANGQVFSGKHRLHKFNIWRSHCTNYEIDFAEHTRIMMKIESQRKYEESNKKFICKACGSDVTGRPFCDNLCSEA